MALHCTLLNAVLCSAKTNPGCHFYYTLCVNTICHSICEIISVCWHMSVELFTQDLLNDRWGDSGQRCGFLQGKGGIGQVILMDTERCMAIYW